MQGQLDYIFFFYGLAFIVLAAICFAFGKRGRYSLPWLWLGCFALANGLTNWLDLVAVDIIDSDAFRFGRCCLLAVSFFCLLEFGRRGVRAVSGRGPGMLPSAILLICSFGGLLYGAEGLNAGIRYCLALTGGLWSALAFILLSRQISNLPERRHVAATGSLFVLYAALVGTVVPRTEFGLAPWLNHDSFYLTFGFPVQLARGFAAVAMTSAVWHVLQPGKSHRERRHVLAFIWLVVCLLAGGWILTETSSNADRRNELGSLLSVCRFSAAALDPGLVERLNRNAGSDTAEYRALRRRLAQMQAHEAEPCRIYLATIRGKDVICAGGSRMQALRQLATLGDPYSTADAPMGGLPREMRGAIHQYKDRDGAWISASVPVNSPATGRPIALLGIDRPQLLLESKIASHRFQPIAITLLAFVLITAFYAAYERQKEAIRRISESEKALRVSQERFVRVAELTREMIWEADTEGLYTYVSQLSETVTGYRPDEMIGKMHFYDLHPPEGREAFRRSGLARGNDPQCFTNFETPIITRDGQLRWIISNGMPVFDERGGFIGFRGSDADITEARLAAEALQEERAKALQAEARIRHQAHHDALTDLPNRLMFSEELAKVASDRRRNKGMSAVMFIDLDRFKLVNDTMGHQAGDDILVEAAARLRSCLREGDVLSRMGGDEFTVLLKNLQSSEQAAEVADRMRDRISLPFSTCGTKLVISTSIGISMYPQNAVDVSGLLRTADAAMYKAKELGRNNCQFYSEQLSQSNRIRIETERDLRLAIDRSELQVYYQPIVEARTMRIVGAEALLRWNHPDKGMISPAVFVPVAEETGMIAEMGAMVLEAACKECRKWRDLGFEDFEISVNVSPVQLRSEHFVEDVLGVMQASGLSPESLVLEITETVLAKNDYGEIDTLSRLKASGIKICLDDFGIGYSSLSRLKDFPIVNIKVDGTFIKDIANSPKDRALTESIIGMSHNMGIKVTAEWIENEDQMATVRTLDCDYAQGYLISPARTAEALEELVKEWGAEPRKKAA